MTEAVRGRGPVLAAPPGQAESFPFHRDLAPLREVQQLTGYIRGGVTALGGKRNYPVYADETMELFDVVSISAGVRGTQILMAPSDYLRVTHASVVAIAKEKNVGS